MTIVCANCGRGFTRDQVLNMRPPHPPHPLTKRGEAALFNNQVSDQEPRPCPGCGNKTLVITR
jgi:DNA-directed RNA polymerase subunit RPC12/RpoP